MLTQIFHPNLLAVHCLFHCPLYFPFNDLFTAFASALFHCMPFPRPCHCLFTASHHWRLSTLPSVSSAHAQQESRRGPPQCHSHDNYYCVTTMKLSKKITKAHIETFSSRLPLSDGAARAGTFALCSTIFKQKNSTYSCPAVSLTV